MINLGAAANDGTGDDLRTAGAKINQALATGTEEVTTGASPVDADVEVLVTEIITGGTGTEVLNLPALPYGPSGYSDPKSFGRLHIFVLKTLADPGDVVSIVKDSGTWYVQSPSGYSTLLSANELILDSEQQNIAVFWNGSDWSVLNYAYDNSTEFAQSTIDVSAPPTTGRQVYSAKNGSPQWVHYLVRQTGVNADITIELPGDALIEDIIVENASLFEIPGGLKFGITDGGTEIAAHIAVDGVTYANVLPAADFNQRFFGNDSKTIYIKSIDADWNGATVNIWIPVKVLN